MPSLGIVKGKSIQNIAWHQMTHPIACNTIADTHTSAIILSSNCVLCCGKDGQLHLFRNSYEVRSNVQTFQFGLGSIQNLISLSSNNTFLLSISNNPTIVEIHVDIKSE